MKSNCLFSLTIVFAFLHLNASANSTDEKEPFAPSHTQVNDYDKNILKVNLTSAVLRYYSLQYERLLSRKISAGIGMGYMPSGKLPLLAGLEPVIDDPDTYAHLQNLSIGAFSVTPEVRFYLGKHSGARGFYIAPFARYSDYQLRFDNFTFEPENAPSAHASIALKGNLSGITGGLLLGSQWRLGKRIYLDWWIAGAGYGRGKGELNGAASLSNEEQQALKLELDALQLPFVKSETTVDANGAYMKLAGPWADLRAGISLGISF